MLFELLLLLLILLAAYLLTKRNSARVECFQASCELKPAVSYKPEQVQALVDHATTQVNQVIEKQADSVKLGPLTLKGISTGRITKVELGNRTKILPCTSECVCQKSDYYPKSASVQLAGANVTVEVPEVEINIFGGLKLKAPLSLTLKGVEARIETDCQQHMTIASVELSEVVINQPEPGTRLRKLLDSLPDHKGKLLAALQKYVVGQNFELPLSLADTPLLCAGGA